MSIRDNLNGNIEMLKRNMSSPYNFKGSTTFAALPTSGNAVNDTYYCTDKKCKYTWNGLSWFQSSLNESEYEETLAAMSEDVQAKHNEAMQEIAAVGSQLSLEIANYSGLRNFVVDPKFERFGDVNVNINKYMFIRTFTGSSFSGFTANAGGLTKPSGSGSVSCMYGFRVKYIEELMGDKMTFSINITRAEGDTGNVIMYIRFLDVDGTNLHQVTKNTAVSGRFALTAEVPLNAYEIQVWVNSNSDYEWSISKPIFVSGSNDVEFSTQLWDLVMLETDNEIHVTDCNGLLRALTRGGFIFLDNDIEVTEKLLPTEDCTIFGNGHTLTANGTDGALLSIVGVKCFVYNTNFIGDVECDYNVVVNTDGYGYFENCIIHYAKDSIVRCPNTAVVVMKNCDIGYSQNNDGLSPAGSADVRVYNCKFHDNYDEGISSHNSSYTEVHNCEFYNNGYIVGTKEKGADSSFGGCHIGGGRMGIVANSYSHDNCTHGFSFINFQDLTQADIEKCYGNVSENNGEAGFWFAGARNITATNNTAIGNGEAGIHVSKNGGSGSSLDLPESVGYVVGNTLIGNITNTVVIDDGSDGGITMS